VKLPNLLEQITLLAIKPIWGQHPNFNAKIAPASATNLVRPETLESEHITVLNTRSNLKSVRTIKGFNLACEAKCRICNRNLKRCNQVIPVSAKDWVGCNLNLQVDVSRCAPGKANLSLTLEVKPHAISHSGGNFKV
jgi:hypothetical protein